ncbi:MAG TPA: YdcF family protein [Chitinophagaceae bacterium]|jgi:uncharacterized SAM-binding protein YcdF (DUF218 family)
MGKYDGDGYVLFVSLRSKNNRLWENAKIKFRSFILANRSIPIALMFLLGKLFLLLLKPTTWIVVIFLIGLISKNPRRQRRWLLTAFCLLIFFSNPFFFRILAKSYERKPVNLAENEKYQAGIVLGGFVSYNVKTGEAYFNPASDRFIETESLYKTGHISKIIVSAGNGYVVKHNFQEASFVKDRLVEDGIPANDIYTDGLSRNTYENAVNTKKICDSLHLAGPFLLISSAIHLPRAEALFKKQKLDVHSYPCDFLTQNIANNFWEDYLIPSAYTLSEWDLFIKELSGLFIYKMMGKA